MKKLKYNSDTRQFSTSGGKFDFIIYDDNSNGLDNGKIIGLITKHLDDTSEWSKNTSIRILKKLTSVDKGTILDEAMVYSVDHLIYKMSIDSPKERLAFLKTNF